MDIKTNWGLKPVKEKISFNEATDVPLYKQPQSYNNYKERISVPMKDVKDADKALINKSDYTNAGD